MTTPKGRKKTLAVIYGGRSGEHEVSLVSGRAVMDAADRTRFEILPVKILKDGRWKVGEKGRPGPVKIGKGNLNGRCVDVAFPVIHGTYGEDGRLQGLLEMAGIPYVGCDVQASAVCMDKDVTKRLLRQTGLPVADDLVVTDGEWRDAPSHIRRETGRRIGYPCFIKPARLGSSVGVVKVKRRSELDAALRQAFTYDTKALIERAVPDARELECAVLGNGPYEVAGPGEIILGGEFYDFHDKYVDGQAALRIPADAGKALKKEVANAAVRACAVLGVSGLARVDFLLPKDSRRWILNEVNTMPGFTSVSMYPKLCAAPRSSRGMERPFRTLITDLVRLALRRRDRLARKRYDFDSGSDWYL